MVYNVSTLFTVRKYFQVIRYFKCYRRWTNRRKVGFHRVLFLKVYRMKVTAFALFLPKFNEADIIILNLFVIINITNGNVGMVINEIIIHFYNRKGKYKRQVQTIRGVFSPVMANRRMKREYVIPCCLRNIIIYFVWRKMIPSFILARYISTSCYRCSNYVIFFKSK